MGVSNQVRGKRIALVGGGGLSEQELANHGCDVLAVVNGSAQASNRLGLRPDLVFLDEWLLNDYHHDSHRDEQKERLFHLKSPLLKSSQYVLLKSHHNSTKIDTSQLPWVNTTTLKRIGVSQARRASTKVLRDGRIGSFPHFRMSTGMTAAIMMLYWGAHEIRMFGFDPIEGRTITGKRSNHVLADTYAVILEAARGKRLRFVSSPLSVFQSNWGDPSPPWAKRTLRNSIYFLGFFWW